RLGDARSPWLQVVGVVSDVKHNGLESESSLEAYAPFAQMAYPYFSVMLRAGNAASFAEAIRQEVQGFRADGLPLLFGPAARRQCGVVCRSHSPGGAGRRQRPAGA